MRPRALVVLVAAEHDAASHVTGGDVVRAARGRVFTPAGSIGVLSEIAWKNGIETIEAKSGGGQLQRDHERELADGAHRREVERNAAAGEFILALTARWKAYWKFLAVTFSPLLSLCPGRMWKV